MDYLVSHHNLQQLDNILVTINKLHGDVHDGDHYKAHLKSPTLGDGGTIEMYIKAPDSAVRIHAFAGFSGELGGIAEIRESATVSLSGSVLTVFNSNRNSSNTSTVAVRSSPTLTASGTQISYYHVGGGFQGRETGAVKAEAGWILKQGTIYILRYISATAANEAEVSVSFEKD